VQKPKHVVRVLNNLDGALVSVIRHAEVVSDRIIPVFDEYSKARNQWTGLHLHIENHSESRSYFSPAGWLFSSAKLRLRYTRDEIALALPFIELALPTHLKLPSLRELLNYTSLLFEWEGPKVIDKGVLRFWGYEANEYRSFFNSLRLPELSVKHAVTRGVLLLPYLAQAYHSKLEWIPFIRRLDLAFHYGHVTHSALRHQNAFYRSRVDYMAKRLGGAYDIS